MLWKEDVLKTSVILENEHHGIILTSSNRHPGKLFLFFRWQNLRGPPCIQGWVPWIGAGFEFGKAPLEFIEKARLKYGPIFTIFAMGNRMTFVTEEEGIDVFLKSKHVNFELAVQNPIYHTAWIPKNVFLALHEKLYVLMKGKMETLNMHQFTGQLTEEFREQLENLGAHGTMDLNNFVRVVFQNKRKIKEFYQHFKTYDEGFECGTQLPEWLLSALAIVKIWKSGKLWVLALASHLDLDRTFMQAVLDIVETETGQHSPNYVLLLCSGHLHLSCPTVRSPDIHKTILEGISSMFGTAGKDKIKVSEDDLKKLPLIKWCVLEAIRLRAPGVITRKVVKPVKILLSSGFSHTVPPGDLLMVSPFWLHRNPEHFLELDSFKPERWKEANLDKNVFLDCFMAFGGMKFQCPGRWFALLEIQICIILVLYKYDCSLLDPLPKQVKLSSFGGYPPARREMPNRI
ncbi:Cyp39a1 [Phodopus roborovskii]|uniref:Cyp39a1 protein n=1 Tax=Phodopus roborovskii TaxID=109678 RepID=A0AAV0A5V2_PHORO|nr:Cyp39a1 [Phodopus roborovskii]